MVAGIAQGAGAGLQRLSPGVYRNPQGQLVGNKGQPLPGQPSMKDRARNVANIVSGGQGMGYGRDRARQQPGRSIVNAISQQPPQQPAPLPMQQPAPMAPPENAAALSGQVAQDFNDPAFNGGRETTDMGMTREGRPAEGQQWGNKPYFGDMPQMPRPFMGQNPMMGNFSPEQMSQLYQRFQQPQQPQTVSGMLQQGGQPPQQMSFPQMNNFTPQQQYGQPQGFQQGIVANRQPTAPQGQMSPTELQAIQNGTFKGYNY
jgi:hypothetical protein